MSALHRLSAESSGLSSERLPDSQHSPMNDKIRRHVWWFAFRTVARLNLARAAAWLMVRALGGAQTGSSGQDAKKLLLLSKRGLFEDAASAFEGDQRFEPWYLDMVEIKPFKAMVSAFLPPEIDDFNYLSDDSEVEAGKRAYRDFAVQVLKHFLAQMPFDAVLTASFSYYAEREVAAAFEQLGVPFIALHKENLKTPGIFKFYEEVYRTRRGPFHGRRILVYNGIEKNLQVAAGVAPEGNITVTGMPRLDRIHEWRQAQAGLRPDTSGQATTAHQALFFAFGPKTGLPRMARKLGFGMPEGLEQFGDERDQFSWDELARSYHRAAVEVARQMPDIRVIVKAKPVPFEFAAIRELLGDGDDLPENLTLISSGDPMELILKSNVVCGFRTTALLEVIAAGKPLIVPHFAEAATPQLSEFIFDVESAAEYADSEEDIVRRVCHHLTNSEGTRVALESSEMTVLEKWTGNVDGKSGARVANAVHAEILGAPVEHD